jgi:hypothetical protein
MYRNKQSNEIAQKLNTINQKIQYSNSQENYDKIIIT